MKRVYYDASLALLTERLSLILFEKRREKLWQFLQVQQ